MNPDNWIDITTYTRSCSVAKPIDTEQEPGLEILVVSLKSDARRREQLRNEFPRTYPTFRFIDAYDLRKLNPSDLQRHPELRGKRISPYLLPPEVGCSLSHMEALCIAARSPSKSVLILEDDVIGNDRAVDVLREIIQRLPRCHFMLCGGQEGLQGRRFLRGQPESGIYRIPEALRRFTARASSYLVSPDMAKVILARHSRTIRRADDWWILLRGESNFFFLELFSHPTSHIDSHLEGSRRSKPLHQRLNDDGIAYTMYTQVLKIALPFISTLRGWRKISPPTSD
jgi:glycosyl transferase family 25